MDSKSCLTRAKVDRIVAQRYERLQLERDAAGSNTLAAEIKGPAATSPFQLLYAKSQATLRYSAVLKSGYARE